MAVLLLTPRDETFERVRSLSGIARVVLTLRLVFGLLVTVWLTLSGMRPATVVTTVLAMFVILLVMLRWESVGSVLLTHPAALALDAGLCFTGLAVTGTLSPVILLCGTGALMTGICLDRRGALVFTPLYAATWWLVYSFQTDVSTRPADLYLDLLVIPALLVATLYLGAGIRGVVLRAASTEQRLREETRTAGVAEERARMAREMHDSLIKSLHGLALVADTLPAWMDRSPERAQAQARQLAEMIKSAGTESRAMVLTMRRTDARQSVVEQLDAVLARWRATTGRRADLEATGKPELSTESSYELAAIVSEALENVRRHTEPTDRVLVTLVDDGPWVLLEVTDRGPGFVVGERADDDHFGLLGMRERAARVGGRLTLTSTPGRGTTVSVAMPSVLAEVSRPDDDPLGATVRPVRTRWRTRRPGRLPQGRPRTWSRPVLRRGGPR